MIRMKNLAADEHRLTQMIFSLRGYELPKVRRPGFNLR